MYANWTLIDYTITYNLNNGTNNANNPVTYTILDMEIVLEDPTRTGYTFERWYVDPEFGLSTNTISAGSNGNRTFYAKWIPIDYTITYNLNNGTNSGSNPTTYNTEDANITLVDPTRTNFVFMGWFTDTAFENSFNGTITSGSLGALILYAEWGIEVTVVIDEVEQTATVAEGSSTIGVATVLDELAPDQVGYTYTWYYDNPDTSTKTLLVGSSYVLGEDGEIYGEFVANTYAVSFDSNEGTEVEQITVTYDSTIGTLPTPTRTGYTFAGWYLVSGDTETEVESTTVFNATTFGSASNATLVARWTELSSSSLEYLIIAIALILFLTLLLLVTYYMFRKKNIKAIEQNKKFKALEEKNQSKQNIESNEQSNKKDKK